MAIITNTSAELVELGLASRLRLSARKRRLAVNSSYRTSQHGDVGEDAELVGDMRDLFPLDRPIVTMINDSVRHRDSQSVLDRHRRSFTLNFSITLSHQYDG